MLPPSLSNGISNFGTEQGSGGGALKEITLSFVFSSLLEAPFHLNQAAALEFVTQTPVISFSTSLTCHPPPPPPPPPPPSSHFFPTRQSVKSDQLPKGLLKPSGAANAYSLYGNRNGKCALGIYKHFFLPFKISLDFFNLFTTENPKVRQRSGLFR